VQILVAAETSVDRRHLWRLGEWRQQFAWFLVLIGLVAGCLVTRTESAEIHIAQLYGLGYLPVHVVVERQLIEAQAASAGLPPVTVTPVQLSGGPTANDLLLSGQSDVRGAASPS
jgi:NitT/TauT family transport system substrate-binding protein